MKNLKLLFLFTLLYNFVHAQDRKICTYTKYINVSEYIKEYPVTDTIRNEALVFQIDSILIKENQVRNFDIKKHKSISYSITTINDSSSVTTERIIVIPNSLKSLKVISSSNIKNVLALFHAIGHELYRHILINGFDNQNDELEADAYSGYMIKQLGVSIEDLEEVLKILEFPNTNIFPNIEKRKNAILSGWKANEINIPKGILILEKDEILENFYSKKAKKYEEENYFILATENWIKAYQYSNGSKIDFLLYAAIGYLNSKDNENAILMLMEMLKSNYLFLSKSHISNALQVLSMIYFKNDEFDLSEYYLEIFLEINSNDLNYIQNIAKIKLEQKDWQGYMLCTKSVLKIMPNRPDIYNDLAKAYIELSKPEEAIKYYKRALAIKPDYLESRMKLVTVYQKIADDMTVIMTKLIHSNDLKYNTPEPDEYANIAKARQKILYRITEVLEEGLITNPDSLVLKNRLLENYKNSGETQKAENLTKVIVTHPDSN
tara:strand:+ start:256 stop:1731 length:1476 start_codon:yes stop_codon:yes gene_type:complete